MVHTPAQSGPSAGAFALAAAQDLVTMQSFVTLLEQERGALEEGKADALPGLAAEKATLIESLSRSAEQRARLLGVSATAASVEQVLGTDSGVRQVWRHLLDTARRASDLNSGNGLILNLYLAHVDRAINAISGPRTSLYSTSGIASRGPSVSRSLGRG